MKKLTSILIIFLVLNSCKKNERVLKADEIKNVDKLKNPKKETDIVENSSKYRDTLEINYLGHKNLLEILKILPDSTMASWGWKASDRVNFVDFIEKNNFTIDSTEQYQNIKIIKPNTIGIQIVDGYWTLSIYKVNPNNYIVITDDIVGGGNDIKTFEFINGKLISKKINFFKRYLSQILKEDSKCLELLEDNNLFFEYNFEDESKIIIKNLILSDEDKNCFKGNILHYKLNLKSQNFDLIKVD